MASAWRQGSFISPADAIALGLVRAEFAANPRVIVITHSCDLANPRDEEAEVLVGEVVDESVAKAFANGHSTRKLSLQPSRMDGNIEFDLFETRARVNVSRARLDALHPWGEVTISSESKQLLQRWLAQRYARAEFPDAFVSRLQQSGVDAKLEFLAKIHSRQIRSIYFDLASDDEKVDPGDCYELGIYLVYDGSSGTARCDADLAAKELESVFRKKCHLTGAWKWIELLYCEAISDEAFSISAANEFRRWRLEHRSIQGEPAEKDA